MAPPLPTYSQFTISTLLLLGLSLTFLPLSFLTTAIAWFLRRASPQQTVPRNDQKTVLINGSKMYKSLGMVRAFGQAGCRVVVCESGIDGYFSATRFSRYTSAYYSVPTVIPGKTQSREAYINALVRIAEKENVSLFVPCSGAGTTIEDAQAAERIRESFDRIKVFIPSASLTQELHEKDLFMELCKSLGVPTPSSFLVSDPDSAMNVIKSSKTPMILKATAVLDDLGRNDMTQYPLKGDSEANGYAKTLQRLKNGLSVPMTKETPYVVQQFVEGSEWCTHATVHNGQLVAIICCPSNDMLMRYENHTATEVGKKAEVWTRQFLEAWAQSEKGQKETLQGHFSMDFILSSATGELFPIECNPRVHTAICLYSSSQFADFAETYLSSPSFSAALKPLPSQRPCSWIGHDLPALWSASILPEWARAIVHPYWQTIRSTDVRLDSVDPTWDTQDPVPFLVLYHLQWPWLLLKQLLWKRRRWVRINASTSRIFEAK